MTYGDILTKINELEVARDRLLHTEPCPKHGDDYMEICPCCLESVYCSKCKPDSCQCWNDE